MSVTDTLFFSFQISEDTRVRLLEDLNAQQSSPVQDFTENYSRISVQILSFFWVISRFQCGGEHINNEILS